MLTKHDPMIITLLPSCCINPNSACQLGKLGPAGLTLLFQVLKQLKALKVLNLRYMIIVYTLFCTQCFKQCHSTCRNEGCWTCAALGPSLKKLNTLLGGFTTYLKPQRFGALFQFSSKDKMAGEHSASKCSGTLVMSFLFLKFIIMIVLWFINGVWLPILCSSNKISSEGCAALGPSLENLTLLEDLDLRCVGIGQQR